MIEPTGYMVEIFKGIQGEGLWTGEAQIFLRFAGCNLSCRYCDTEYALTIPLRYKKNDEYYDNPVALVETIDIVKGYGSSSNTVSITGGEPLLQVGYLKALLPLLKGEGYRIYLETNATLPKQLSKVLKWVDIVAADIKLPSFTGETNIPEEHREFLYAAREKDLFVKVVVTDETVMDEISMAVDIIRGVDMNIPLVIQPAMKNGQFMKNQERLLGFHDYARTRLSIVRLIPQIHKLMGWK
ncbi:7-carboxy-7-deazaguanine synthase QueE [bacterium]|nr:7-carboxy-7-deazaguanine synthase QueE [bacterium]MBU1752622.1 7-carboxy-7-deazaguanine synthase QueE [bacterium]